MSLHTIILQSTAGFTDNQINGLAVLAVIIVIIVIATSKRTPEVHTNEVFSFSEFQFSGKEFYTLLQERITAKNMPGVKFSKIKYPESSIVSAKREYLRVERNDDIFDICAAHFGTGSFVSYWHGEPKKRLKELLRQIPKANTVIDALEKVTRFESDTAKIFRLWIKECINQQMDEITKNKGIRISPEELAATADI